MGYILLALLLIGLFMLYQQKRNKAKPDSRPSTEKETITNDKELQIEGAYTKRWLFSYNEKDAYNRLKPIAEKMGYTVFAKVRLLDLLEPVKNNPKYKTYFYKIQAKHVDFVLCDEKLVARHIIELDDSSHDREDRKARDAFVDSVLKSVGYNIIHTRTIDRSIENMLKPRQEP